VDRFQQFYVQANSKKTLNIKNFNYAFYRLSKGLIKKYFIADTLARLISPMLNSPQNYPRLVVVIGIYCLAIRIYLDFSGYTDMAIGIAKLFGYEIMENFNRPFFQKNISLFWRNWHISVYSWIRDYFFFPLFGSRASVFKLYFGIFLSMVVFHLWHAPSIGFLILGVYHGCGLMLWQLFQVAKKKLSFLRKIVSYQWMNPVSIFITFSFVSFGFIFFNADFNCSAGILKRIFLKG
jgi:D-alanyl-lipoteichoic acid acyltransferase DltB (MBOAT superfamily)